MYGAQKLLRKGQQGERFLGCSGDELAKGLLSPAPEQMLCWRLHL